MTQSGQPKAASKPHTLCISKKAAPPRRPPSEASAHRSQAVKREMWEPDRAVLINLFSCNYKLYLVKLLYNPLCKSPLAAFEDVYSHELKVTSLINDLMKLAREENDYATEVLLQWFVNEQVEEEANALLIVEKLKVIKDSANGLFMLDHESGERK